MNPKRPYKCLELRNCGGNTTHVAYAKLAGCRPATAAVVGQVQQASMLLDGMHHLSADNDAGSVNDAVHMPGTRRDFSASQRSSSLLRHSMNSA